MNRTEEFRQICAGLSRSSGPTRRGPGGGGSGGAPLATVAGAGKRRRPLGGSDGVAGNGFAKDEAAAAAGGGGGGGGGAGAGKTAEAVRSRSDFHAATAEIARDINRASALVSTLTRLVRQQTLFDDRGEEINNLIFRIKTDIADLNGKVEAAQEFVDSMKQQRAGAFGGLIGGGSVPSANSAESHTISLVSQLKMNLMSTTKGFKDVLVIRSAKMREQQTKKDRLGGGGAGIGIGNGFGGHMPPPPTGSSASAAAGAANGRGSTGEGGGGGAGGLRGASPLKFADPYEALRQREQREQRSAGTDLSGVSDMATVEIDLSSPTAGSSSTARNEQQQQLLLAPPTQEYLESRQAAVTEVERTIGQLAGLFNRLSTMLSEQNELVQRIEDDVEEAEYNTGRGQEQITRAYRNLSSNRPLLIKLSIILVLFFFFFIIFVL